MFKWKLIDQEDCTFCKSNRETLEHLLAQCPKVIQLWFQLKDYLQEKFSITIEIDTKKIILNRIYDKKYHVANFICLVTKQFIYKQRWS